MQKAVGYIYKFTMVPTGLIYVGKRQKSQFDEKYFGSGKICKCVVKHYGKQNVLREVLQWCYSIKELETQEKFWIEKLNATNPKKGYNLSLNSSNACMIGENNPSTGKHWWTNGEIQVFQVDCPEGFYSGCLNSKNKLGKHKYSNGTIEIVSNTCPEGFTNKISRGNFQTTESKKKISEASANKHWYNNGIVQVFRKECPEGFVVGQLESVKKKISQTLQGSRWMNNSIQSLQVKPEEFEYYINNGYVFGRLPLKQKGGDVNE